MRILPKTVAVLLAVGSVGVTCAVDASTVSIRRTSSGEVVVRVETNLPQPPEVVWEAFSNPRLLQCWVAPVVRLDLRSGGSLTTHYTSGAKIGDPGTISLGILNYVENESITYKVKLNDSFSSKLQAEDGMLQEVIQLQRLPAGGTRLVSSMVGWGSGPEWEKAAQFFAQGNKSSYEELAKCIGPPAR